MEADKFEEHIKKELRDREISPSAAAWENLSKKLDADSNSNKRSYLKYVVAACFIGVSMITTLYINSGSITDDKSVEIVNIPESEVKEVQEVEVDEQKLVHPKIIKSNVPKISNLNTNIEEKPEIENRKEAIVEIEKVNPLRQKIEHSVKPIDTLEAILNSKIEAVVAQVNAIKVENNNITEAEVDSLLFQAQNELLSSKLFLKNSKVDPMVLLTGVEDELDQSLRDKLFNRLKTGFVKVKTAVADNNN